MHFSSPAMTALQVASSATPTVQADPTCHRPARPGDGAALDLAIAIRVTDTGAGIPPDRLRTLFGEFQQADDVVQRKR